MVFEACSELQIGHKVIFLLGVFFTAGCTEVCMLVVHCKREMVLIVVTAYLLAFVPNSLT